MKGYGLRMIGGIKMADNEVLKGIINFAEKNSLDEYEKSYIIYAIELLALCECA